MSRGVGHRSSLDPALLWLWCRPTAIALIRPLTWEPPCAVGVALKSKAKNKTKQKMGVSISARCVKNPTEVLIRDASSIPGLTQWVKDPALLWLWYRLISTASAGPVAWELPDAAWHVLL